MYSMVPTICSGLRHSVAAQRPRQTEIHYQNSARAILHDVLRFQIAVNHANAVCRIERLAYLLNKFHRFLSGKFLLFADEGP